MVLTWEAKVIATAAAVAANKLNWKHKVTPDWGDLMMLLIWNLKGKELLSTVYSWYILQLCLSRYFSWKCGNSLDPIHRRQFFAKSAHHDSLCSCLQVTIFREINSSLPINAGWNTCCAMVSHARQSIDTSIVSQNRVQLIQCLCHTKSMTAWKNAQVGVCNLLTHV